MKVLFVEDEEHFKGFNIDIKSSDTVFGGYWKLSLGLLNLKDFDIVVSTLQHSNLSRKIIQKANYLKKITVLIVDGIFEWNNSYNNDYLRSIGVSLFSENIYDYVYISSDSVLRKYLIGDDNVRYLPFHNKRIFTSTNENRNGEITQGNKVLISFANTPYFNDEERDNLYSLVRKLIDALDNLGIDYDYRVFNGEIVADLGIGDSKNNIRSAFKDIVKNYKAVISTPSSVCLDAMGYNIPVAQLYYRDTPQAFQTAWTIHQGVNLKNTLLSIINPEDEKIRYQSMVYEEHVHGVIDFFSLEKFKSSAKDNFSKNYKLSFTDIEVYKRLIYQKIKKNSKLTSIIKKTFNR